MDGYTERLAQAQEYAEKLLNSKRYDFDGLKRSDLQEDYPVVYAIFDKVDGSCLYVGRTKKLRQRLYTNHLMGRENSARLKKYLKEDPDKNLRDISAAKTYLINNCYFQYLHAEDTRLRGQIEGLLSFLLDVKYIEVEH